MKNSLKVKAFSILMLLLFSMSAAVYLGHSSSIQLKQTAEFGAASEEPLRVAIECANSSHSQDDPNNDPVYSMLDLFESRGYETAIVNGTDIDTVEELNNYDVVVMGDSGESGDNDFAFFDSALKDWVQNGGGVVATGWIIFAMGLDSNLDQILPVSPSYDYEYFGNITMISENNSITQGVNPFPIYGYVEFPYSHVADPGATVLGFTISTGYNNSTVPAMPMPVVVSWSYGLGKTAYLGPIYFGDFESYENEGLYTDMDAVRLLLNSVEWAAGRTPTPIVAKCLILSNRFADTCALDFTLKIPDVDFAWMDVSSETPTYSNLSAYDVVLLFEDGGFSNAPNVGSAVYDYVMSGGNLVIGTFYEQDRSDRTSYVPNGWGPLETIDPFTTDGYGCAYSPDELNVSSIVAHPITSGVQSLWCDQYQGGVHAKADTAVVANWTGTNEFGEPCPLAGYRVLEDNQRVVQISIYPNYGYYNTTGTAVSGDFYTLWANAIKWASEALYTGPQILEELTQISSGNQEENPSIALDHNGNLNIVWVGNDTANLYYMMVDKDGNILINETCLDPSPSATAYHVRRPSIGVDSDNDVHIVFHAQNIYEPWPDYTNSTTLDSQEVVYLKINPYLDDMNGSSANYVDITLIPETIISTRDTIKSRAPNLAVDSEDNVHVVWFDNEIKSSMGELHYLVVNSTGGIIVPETNITSGFYTDVDWSEPEIVVDSHDNAHVFFVTEGWTGSTYSWRDIWYTMIDGSTGDVLINSTQLTNSSETWKYARPFIDIDSEDEIHIVWHDSRFKDNGTGAEEIFYVEIDPYLDDRSGNSADPATIKVVDEMLVSENDYVKSYLANIAVDKNGLFNIIWINEWTSTYTDLYYAIVDQTGNKLVSEYRMTHENGTLNFAAWFEVADRGPQIAVANGRIFIVDMAQDINSSYYNIWLTIAFVDKNPPTTSINYTAYTHAGKDWLSAASPISLLAIDEESNVTATYCKIDDDSWQTYDQPFNLSSLADGVHIIQYYSIDYFGNEEDAKNQTVYLDTTAPKIYTPIRYPTGDIQYGQAVKILVNINDSGSRVKEAILHYSLDNGTTWTNVTMNYNSTSGFYEETIPAQSSNMTVKYVISASDNVDNNAVQDNSGMYYSYPVIPELSSTMLLATVMLLTIMATILIKKRGKKVVR